MRRRVAGAVLGAVLLLAGATGCGGDESAGERVPALSQRLDDVDAALAAGRYGQAREALGALAAATAEAEAAGDLSPEQADEIEQAVAALRAALPQPTTAPADDVPEASEPAAPSEPTTSAPAPAQPDEDEPDEDEPDEDEPDEDEGNGKGEGNGKDKGKDKDKGGKDD